MGQQSAAAWDVYREIHKAMRFALFGVTAQAGNTDWADDAAVAGLVAEWKDVLMVLNGHHHHEDDFCDSLVQQHAPALRETLEQAHDVADTGLAHLDALADALVGAAPDDRWAALRTFYLDLADFTATYISHLRFEEDLVMPVLNESLTDEQLAQVTSDIRMSVPPPEMCIFIRYMAPSMNPAERADMLRGMRLAPPEIFEMFRDAAEKCLSPSDYQRLAVDAGFA
jgi:hypothetical protein